MQTVSHTQKVRQNLADLPTATSSELKRQGWRNIMLDVHREGHLLVTNHNIPEAVILPPEQYDKLRRAAAQVASTQEEKLEALRLRFRQRVQCLQEAGGNEKLEAAMLRPLNLDGQVLAGEGY